MELTAKAALDKRVREQRALQALEKRVKTAMETYLLDPFSAQYRTLRSGRNGAVCGQVNGKNRFGNYVGFRDFVLGRDGKTIFMSNGSDGVSTELYSSFAEAYVNVCASRAQIARHKAATAPSQYYEDDDYYDAAAAASAAATDAAAAAADEYSKKM